MNMRLYRRFFLAVFVALAPVPGIADVGPALTGLAAGGDDATSVFFSPAAITRLDKPEWVIQTAVVYEDSKFEVDQASMSGGSADNDDGVLFVPGVYYVRPLGERWRLGVSVNVPSGIGHDYGLKWAGRYLAEESTLAFVAAAAPLAYKVNDQWSIAAGPYMIYTDSVSKARVNNLLPEYGDGSVKLEEDGAAFGWLAGVMFEPTASTRFGLSYKSSIEPDLKGTPTFANLDPLVREALAAANLLGTEVDVDFKVPAIAQGGFYTEFADRWAVTGDVVWIDMSEFGVTHIRVAQDSVSVRSQGFDDTWITSVGLKYRHSDDRTYSVGAMYVTEPIKDSRRQITLPLDRVIGVGAGVEQPCWSHYCKIALNYFDLGDGDVSEDGGPLFGSIDGSFSHNWAVMLDFQLKMNF